MDEARRTAKEEYVSGLSGTSVWECQLVLLQTVLSYALWKALANKYPIIITPSMAAYATDFLTLVLPFIISITTPCLWQTAAILAISCVFVRFLPSKPIRPTKNTAADRAPPKGHIPCLTAVRGCLQIVTVICILAVDFRAFPQRFAKTETFGTSLMDLGVGLFIFSGGIVAGPRLKSASDKPLQKLWKSIRLCVPVIFFGLMRMILTKGVNYQEHVTEYGVHWNFFMTLGLIPLFVTIFQIIAPLMSFSMLGAVIIIGYTILLNRFGLQDFILTAPRDTLFNMNREGICSFLGYLSIFLLSAEIGSRLRAQTAKGPADRSLGNVIRDTTILCIFFYTLLYVAAHMVNIPVSRRMANISYTVWTLAASLSQLFGCAVVDSIYGSTYIPILYTAVNRNQLSVFLLGNVLTGLINLSINTLDVSDPMAIMIITAYALTIETVAVALDRVGWTLKL